VPAGVVETSPTPSLNPLLNLHLVMAISKGLHGYHDAYYASVEVSRCSVSTSAQRRFP